MEKYSLEGPLMDKMPSQKELSLYLSTQKLENNTFFVVFLILIPVQNKILMRKIIYLGALLIGVLYTTQTKAQSNYACREALEAAFGSYNTNTPVTLNRLGTSPQFGEIRLHTADGAYNHLKNVYRRNGRKSRNEIDRLLRLIGYTGFTDPAFSAAAIEPTILSKGTTGWMGAYSAGYKYRWSVLGRDFETFKVKAKDSPCFIYIMKKCGNAFYMPNPPEKVDCPPCPDCPRPLGFVGNADPYCPACAPCPPPCKTSTLNISGKGEINSGDIVSETMTLPVVASFGDEKVCLGEYTVPVSATYEYAASGSAAYSQTINICDNGKGVPPTMDIKLPVNLKFSLVESDLAVGENGVLVMNVPNEKRFKALKKQFGLCPASFSPSNTATSLTAPSSDKVAMETSSGTIGSVDGQCSKQTINMSGMASAEDVKNSTYSNTVTIVGVYNKTGKLAKGENANKYLCLGNYSVPGKSGLAYSATGNTSFSQVMNICDVPNATDTRNLNIPVDLDVDVESSKMTIGQDNRIYVPLTAKQYKKMGKRFSRCCSDGSKGCF